MNKQQMLMVLVVLTLLFPATSFAVSIIGPGNISFFSENGTTTTYFGNAEQTVDGLLNTSSANGYAYAGVDVLFTYNFDVSYDLSAFLLMGKVGGLDADAVKDFEVKFFDGVNGGGTQIGSIFSATHTDYGNLEFFDISGGGYANILSFTFKGLTVADSGLTAEFSEIQFEGNATASIPEPATMLLFGIGLVGIAGTRNKKMIPRCFTWVIG